MPLGLSSVGAQDRQLGGGSGQTEGVHGLHLLPVSPSVSRGQALWSLSRSL